MKLLACLMIIAATFSHTFAQFGQLIGPDGAQDDNFGSSVAVSGNTVVVGAPGDNHPLFPNINVGGAYVYVTDGVQWTMQQYLLGSDLDSQSEFGNSVAIDGNTIVVGADNDQVAGARVGSAFVMERFGSSWFQTAQLVASDAGGPGFEAFGYSVAVSRDTIVIGAPLKTINSNAQQGAVYVFVRNGSGWIQQAKLTASDGDAADQFGRSVAISGDLIIVGSTYDPPRGSAYVFSRQGSVWSETAKLTASDGLAGEFGNAVAISGATAVVGAPSSTIVSGGPITGAAYVYTNSASGWTETKKLVASLPGSLFNFGSSVSVHSGLILIGSETAGSGTSYLFRRQSGHWRPAGQIVSFVLTPNAEYGHSVGLSKGNNVVGARRDDIQSRVDQGSAFVGTGLNFNANIGGRVVGSNGRGVSNLPVVLTNSQTVTRYAVTNPFGYYRFIDVPAIQTYTLSVGSKRFSYPPRTIVVDDDLPDLDFAP